MLISLYSLLIEKKIVAKNKRNNESLITVTINNKIIIRIFLSDKTDKKALKQTVINF